MMPSNFEIIDYPNGAKLVRDGTRAREQDCFNCHTKGYHSWFFISKIILDQYTMLPICTSCNTKVIEWYKTNPVNVEEKLEERGSPRLVDLK